VPPLVKDTRKKLPGKVIKFYLGYLFLKTLVKILNYMLIAMVLRSNTGPDL
jgi:hypothetical protein